MVRKPDALHDLKALRTRSLLLVWCLFIPFLALTQGTAFLLLTRQGWPSVSMSDIDSVTLFLIVTSAILLYNIPDVFSVIVYFGIWKHFRAAVIPKEEIPLEIPYGGIWVGESFDIPQINEQSPANADAENKVESALKALGWHLKLCLVDMALLSLFNCQRFVVHVMYLLQIVCVYWIPFLVIKNGGLSIINFQSHNIYAFLVNGVRL